MTGAETLHLVYDAPSGPLAAVLDGAKKLFGLDSCPLCAITHGIATERPAWQACKQALALPVESWHRDDVPEELRRAAAGAFPAVLLQTERGLVPLLGPTEIRSCAGSPDRLQTLISQELARRGLGPG